MDWKKKLTSRKFWAAIASFVSMLIVALRGDASEAETVAGLIMAGAAVVAYIVGEGLADAAGAGTPDVIDVSHELADIIKEADGTSAEGGAKEKGDAAE